MVKKTKTSIVRNLLLYFPLLLLFISVFNEFDFNYINYSYFFLLIFHLFLFFIGVKKN